MTIALYCATMKAETKNKLQKMKQSQKIVFGRHPHDAVVLQTLGNTMYYKKRRATNVLSRLLENLLASKNYGKGR